MYEENLPTLNVFLSMSTQWVWRGGEQPRRVGLDFSNIKMEMKLAGIKKKRRIKAFGDLKRMESAALTEWNK